MNNNIIIQDSLSGTIIPQKQEPVEPPDIKLKTNLSLPPINPPNVPVINTSKIQPPPNHFDPNAPLNVSIRLSDNMNERQNLIKCNLENQMDIKDLKFNPNGIHFNPEIKQEPIMFTPQQDFKKEPVILKQECPKIEKDCFGKQHHYVLIINAII